MKRRNLERFAILLLAVIGLIHLVQAPEEYAEAPYLSVLFVLNFASALLAIAGVRRRARWGWLLGLAVAAGSITGYVLSRTAGMPGMGVEEWLLPIGVVSLVAETAFVVAAFAVWPQATAAAGRQSVGPRFLAPSAILAIVLAAGAVTGYLETRVVTITQDALVAENGLRVTQISTTLLGGIVDVRMEIVDPDKASPIFNDHESMPYLVVDDDAVIWPVEHHGHTKLLIPGRTYAMFYPNPDGIVKPDSAVSVVFGQQKLAAISVE
jgi:hypothetical protein